MLPSLVEDNVRDFAQSHSRNTDRSMDFKPAHELSIQGCPSGIKYKILWLKLFRECRANIIFHQIKE